MFCHFEFFERCYATTAPKGGWRERMRARPGVIASAAR